MKFVIKIYLLLILNSLTAQSIFFKSYGGDGNDFGEEVIETNDSSFVAVGGTESFGNGLMDLYLLKQILLAILNGQKLLAGQILTMEMMLWKLMTMDTLHVDIQIALD